MISIDFAPMEGITGFVFRNAHHKYYGGISRYYTPFLDVHADAAFSRSGVRDVSIENNKALLADPACTLVPQLLAGQGAALVQGIRTLADIGYREINWNLGCPSPTVTRKGRGAGLLAEPEKIDRILDETFSFMEKEEGDIRLSVKMRIGMDSAEHFPELLTILNRYPLSEIILHPRLAAQGYQGHADEEAFAQALALSAHPLTWNGDISCAEDALRLHRRFPQVRRIMIGRGLITDPALAENTVNRFSEAGGQMEETGPQQPGFRAEKSRFFAFHDAILQGCGSYIPDDKGVLARMKELWGWWEKADIFSAHGLSTDGSFRLLKKIKKAKNLVEYRTAVAALNTSITP